MRLVNAVDPPIMPPNVINPEPELIVKSLAPLIVVVEPLKLMVVSVDVNVMACVESVIGPV